MRVRKYAMRAPLAVCLALVLGCSPPPVEEVAEAPPPRPDAVVEELPNFDPSGIDTRFVCQEQGLQTADGKNVAGQYDVINEFLHGPIEYVGGDGSANPERSRPPGLTARMRRVGEVYIVYAVDAEDPDKYMTASLLEEPIDFSVNNVSLFETLEQFVIAANGTGKDEGLFLYMSEVAAARSEDKLLHEETVSLDMRGKTVREVLCAIIEKSPVPIRYDYHHFGDSPMDGVTIEFPLIPPGELSPEPENHPGELSRKFRGWYERIQQLKEPGHAKSREIAAARQAAKAAAEAAERAEAP